MPKQHALVLSRYKLMATGTTGQKIQQGTGLEVSLMLPGSQGGDVQIAAEVTTGNVVAAIFLIDPTRPRCLRIGALRSAYRAACAQRI